MLEYRSRSLPGLSYGGCLQSRVEWVRTQRERRRRQKRGLRAALLAAWCTVTKTPPSPTERAGIGCAGGAWRGNQLNQLPQCCKRTGQLGSQPWRCSRFQPVSPVGPCSQARIRPASSSGCFWLLPRELVPERSRRPELVRYENRKPHPLNNNKD